ncbi:MAG: ZIP family metal transporter [Mycoplasmatota bacterium]|nr:ZIP family metal transporter [Mycoplasmatota bacterium]
MYNAKLGLLTTLLLGLFIIIGALIAFLIKRKERVVDFSLGLAFSVIIMLIITDMLPEIIEHLGTKHIYLFIIFTVLGFGLLKLLDHFIPDHDDDGKMDTAQEKKENLVHIGIITSCALVLHNIIEGMAVYSAVISNTSLGIAITLGIGFHNIPLGMVIAGTFHQSKETLSKTILSIIAVSLSSFVGGLILFFLNLTAVSSIVLGILLSLTLGMLLFIAISELYPRLHALKNKKTAYIGITIGFLIQLIAIFL